MHSETLVSHKQNSLMQPVEGIFCFRRVVAAALAVDPGQKTS